MQYIAIYINCNEHSSLFYLALTSSQIRRNYEFKTLTKVTCDHGTPQLNVVSINITSSVIASLFIVLVYSSIQALICFGLV